MGKVRGCEDIAMKAGVGRYRQKKVGNVRSKRQRKSEPTARASVKVGGARLKRSKTAKTKTVIQPDRKGEVLECLCTLAYNPKTLRYDLRVDGKMTFSLVSHEACLKLAEDLEVVWED